MARTDYESAYRDLVAWIATEKPGYGRQELLTEAARLAKKHEVPESLLERAVRLFGAPLPPSPTEDDTPATGPSGGGGSAVPDKVPDPGSPTNHKEVHDEYAYAGTD